MGWMVDRALEANHIRSPTGQFRTTNTPKGAQLSEYINTFEDIGFTLAVIADKDVEPCSAPEVKSPKAAEIPPLQRHESHQRSETSGLSHQH
jgi:hypothetical protein